MSGATLAILSDAYARIEDPAHWCQNAYATAADGSDVDTRDRDAVAWCAWGAVDAVAPDGDAPRMEGLLDRAAVSLGSSSAGHLNDKTDHATVLKMYQLAAALLEAER